MRRSSSSAYLIQLQSSNVYGARRHLPPRGVWFLESSGIKIKMIILSSINNNNSKKGGMGLSASISVCNQSSDPLVTFRNNAFSHGLYFYFSELEVAALLFGPNSKY